MKPDQPPLDQPILVWVRGVSRRVEDGKRKEIGGWRMGRAVEEVDGSRTLLADGCMGEWDIPFWKPLPADPE